MEVILLERVNRLGKVGDVVKVKNGFARNYLLPQEKALRASKENKEVFESRRAEIEAKNAEIRAAAEEKAKKLEGLQITLVRQASEEGKLFGSITVRDIEEELENQGYDVPKSQIIMGRNIRETGEYTITVDLYADVEAKIALTVSKPDITAGE